MKPNRKSNRFLRFTQLGASLVVSMTLSSQVAGAATINKANNTNNLNLTTSWTGAVVPTANDVASWTSTVAAANSTVLGADLSWKGVSIVSPGGLVNIGAGNALTLGTSGIDMSAATQNLTIDSSLTLGGGGQSWNVAGGQTLTLATGTFTRSAGATLNLQGSGTFAATMAGLANEGTTGILGTWSSVGTGATTSYATLSAGSLVAYTAGTNVSSASLPNPGTASDNYNLTTASTTAYGAATRNANSLRNTVGATTLTFGNSTSQINLVTNGIMNAGTGTLTVINGGTNASSGILIGPNNGRELVVNAANAGISLGRIVNNTGGASSLTAIGSGANTVTLTGANLYTGATTIAGGTVILNGTGSLNTSSGVIINGSDAKFVRTSSIAGTAPITVTRGTLDGTGSAGGVTVGNGTGGIVTNGNGGTSTLTLASLSFGGAATVNANLAAGTTPVAVTGTLATTPANGTVTVNVNAAGLPNGTHNLISYGSFGGLLADFTLGTVSGTNSRQSTSLTLSGSNLALQVNGDSPKWTGALDGRWTTTVLSAPKNWKLVTAGTTTDFLANDNVLFDDTATGTTTLDINEADVSTGSVTFNNTTKPYLISGAFGIASGTLVKNGTNTVTLTTINAYTGSTTINAGSLLIGDGTTDGSISSTSNIVNNAALVYNRTIGSIFTYAGVISGTGTLTKSGDGTQTLTGANTYSGSTTLSAGTLNANSATALGTGAISVASGANLNLNANITINQAVTGAGNITATGTITVTAGPPVGDFTGFTGTYTQNSGLASTGFQSAAATSRNAAYVISVGTASSQGIIASGNGDYTLEMGSLSGVATSLLRGGNVATGTTIFQIGNLGTDTTFLGSINNGVTKTIGLTKVGAGTLTLAGINTYTLATTISGGTLKLGDGTTDGTIATTSGVTNNAALVYNWIADHAAPYVISGTGSVTKDGAGALTLGGTNTYTGDTILNAGKILVDGDSIADTGKLVINGGTVEPTGTEVVNALFFGGVQQSSGTWGSSTAVPVPDHIDDTHFSGTGLVSVTTGGSAYSTWASSKGLTVLNNGATQDPEFDGISNELEFVLGGNPLASDTDKLPVLTTDATNFIFTFSRADESEAEIGLTFQYGSTLTSWTDVPVTAGNSSTPPVTVNVTENAALPDTVQVLVPKTSAVGGKLFGHLKAVK